MAQNFCLSTRRKNGRIASLCNHFCNAVDEQKGKPGGIFILGYRLTKTVMSQRMRASRAAPNRLLDETDTSLTLITLASAADALGKTWRRHYDFFCFLSNFTMHFLRLTLLTYDPRKLI